MIDSNDPFVWNTHRVNYACAVERPEELSTGEKILCALIVLAAFAVFCALTGYLWATYSDDLRDAWEMVAQLTGVKQ